MRNRVYPALLSTLLMLVVLVLSGCQPLILTPEPEAESGSTMALEANGIWFEAVDVACADGNIVLSDSPFIAGSSVVEGEQDVEAGAKDFTVLATFMPEAYPDSTWVAPGWGIDRPDGNFDVYHSGEGTGAFAGSRIFYYVTSADEGMELPCEPVGPVVNLVGAILTETLEPRNARVTESVDYDIWCKDGNIVISEEPLSKGTSEVEVTEDPDANYFMVMATQYPEAYPGSSWVAPGHGVDMADGEFRVIHYGHGTGDLADAITMSMVTPTDDIAELPCELDGPVVKTEGIYIQPIAAMQ